MPMSPMTKSSAPGKVVAVGEEAMFPVSLSGWLVGVLNSRADLARSQKSHRQTAMQTKSFRFQAGLGYFARWGIVVPKRWMLGVKKEKFRVTTRI